MNSIEIYLRIRNSFPCADFSKNEMYYVKATNDVWGYVSELKKSDVEAFEVGKREGELKNKIAPIIWEKRYSTTEADDKFGRWMRIGRINEMTVAIITKAVHLEKIKYVLRLPNNKGDESLQSDITTNSENEAMLEAEKFIAGYVANFRKME